MAVGDSVVAFNDLDLRSAALNLTQLEQPGKSLKIQIVRDGQTKVFPLLIEAAPPEYAQARLRDLDSVTRALVAASPAALDMARPQTAVMQFRVTTPGPGVVLPGAVNGFWGASLQDLNPDRGKPFGESKGLLVTLADSATPAFRMGLRQWDVVLQVDKRPVASFNDLKNVLGHHPAGQPIEVLISRDHKHKTLKIDPGHGLP